VTGVRRRPLAAALATALVAVVALAGCRAPSIANVTLPGGKAASGPARHVTVYLADALDLVPQSAVHVNDVTVGTVEKVSLDQATQQAKVQLRLLRSVQVPANVTAVLRQTSLLGEKFISLEVPSGAQPSGTLADGAVLAVDKTSEEQQLEDVFGALSALLNGGGVAQLQTIAVELSRLLAGRESTVRDLLTQFTTLTTNLDQRRDEITRALDSVDRLAGQLSAQRSVLVTALQDIAPGLKVLAGEEKDLTSLLQGLDNLGTVAKRVIHETQADTLHDLQALQPTLARLNQAGADLTGSLQLLLSYPFADKVINAVPGDYTGLYVTLNVDLRPGSTAFPLGCTGPLAGSPLPLPNPLSSLVCPAGSSATAKRTTAGKTGAGTGASGGSSSAAGTAKTGGAPAPPAPAPASGSDSGLIGLLGGLLR
jgi:phospholipid/cholesterol/gamma-HCH transport system substrate-binding protein